MTCDKSKLCPNPDTCRACVTVSADFLIAACRMGYGKGKR